MHRRRHGRALRGVPSRGRLWKISRLRRNNAERLPGWILHDPPRLLEPDALSAEGLKTLHLSFDVVGLDIEVYPSTSIDGLDEHFAALYPTHRCERPCGLGHLGSAEGAVPEVTRCGERWLWAVDTDGCETAAMHHRTVEDRRSRRHRVSGAKECRSPGPSQRADRSESPHCVSSDVRRRKHREHRRSERVREQSSEVKVVSAPPATLVPPRFRLTSPGETVCSGAGRRRRGRRHDQ